MSSTPNQRIRLLQCTFSLSLALNLLCKDECPDLKKVRTTFFFQINVKKYEENCEIGNNDIEIKMCLFHI